MKHILIATHVLTISLFILLPALNGFAENVEISTKSDAINIERMLEIKKSELRKNEDVRDHTDRLLAQIFYPNIYNVLTSHISEEKSYDDYGACVLQTNGSGKYVYCKSGEDGRCLTENDSNAVVESDQPWPTYCDDRESSTDRIFLETSITAELGNSGSLKCINCVCTQYYLKNEDDRDQCIKYVHDYILSTSEIKRLETEIDELDKQK